MTRSAQRAMPLPERACHSIRGVGQQRRQLFCRHGAGPMPRISEFFGIVIAMYYNDHAPPHFHARYAEHEAEIEIASLDLLNGSLPRRAMALVLEWAAVHRAELRINWEAARAGRPLARIPGLE
jgi:hypothetical protein